MKKTPEEIIQVIEDLCKEAGYHYLVQIDNGKIIQGQWDVATNSRLHSMARAVSEMSDSSFETTK